MKIVSNSSPLIALAKIEKLDLLEYDLVIPKAVFNETTEPEKEYMKELYEWGKDKVVGVRNRKAVEYLELMKNKIRISEELHDPALELANEN